MHTELKFRVWSYNQKKIMSVHDTCKSATMVWWPKLHALEYPSQGGKPIELPLMQYTGLKDKRGVEIYEGDLIKATGEYAAEVGFRFGTFLISHVNLKGMNGASISDVATDRYKVIGNIYENAEILEQH